MFSLFEKSIKVPHPSKRIHLPNLVKLIKNNSQAKLIADIRRLKKEGDSEYKKLKTALFHITPNCQVENRKLAGDNFEKNFISSSGYIYFDIDEIEDVISYKNDFIKKYGHIVSLVCKSSSGCGLSVLFKIANDIVNKSEFALAWDYIRNNILQDEDVDTSCKDIGRVMYISHDPDVFINYENEIEIVYRTSEEVTHPITIDKGNNRLDYSFLSTIQKEKSIVPIDEVINNLTFKTIVPINKRIVDFFEVDYAELYIPKPIKDGTKHSTYRAMIHQLLYLNPSVNDDYIFSFLWYVNNNYARPKMETRELVRFFNDTFEKAKKTGIIYPTIFKKRVHFNQNAGISGKEKNKIANIINGYDKRNESIEKIKTAKEELAKMGEKMTQRKVMEISGLSLKTVQKYFNEELVNMDDVINKLNNI